MRFALTRRGAIAGLSAALALPGGASALGIEAGPDAAILAAHGHYYAAQREQDRLDGLPNGPFGSPEQLALEALLVAEIDRMDAAVKIVAALPAASTAGLRAKAELVTSALPPAVDCFELDLEDDVVRLVLSLAQDVRRLNGGAG